MLFRSDALARPDLVDDGDQLRRGTRGRSEHVVMVVEDERDGEFLTEGKKLFRRVGHFVVLED